MKSVYELRLALERVDGALKDYEPSDGPAGEDEAQVVKSIWRPEAGLDAIKQREPSESTEDQDLGEIPDFDPVFSIAPQFEGALPVLGETHAHRIRQEILLKGIDALGWYSSFHVRGVQWGAYVSLSGVLYLAQSVFGKLAVSDDIKLRIAFAAILDHELFHFATDYVIGQAELAHHTAWWVWTQEHYRDQTPAYILQEEELANAYMLRRCRSSPAHLRASGKLQSLREFTLAQPEGYKDGSKVKPKDWAPKINLMVFYYAYAWVADFERHELFDGAYDWERQFPHLEKVDWRHCPIHLVDDSHRYGLPQGWVNAFARIESIVETEGFKKRLKKLSRELQVAWERTKTKVALSFTAGCDFKKWPPAGKDAYSLRVNDSLRAHLALIDGTWIAIDIGGHKEMGHG